jgi:acetyl-CoA carboxylase biotin carboxyl carrier protein
MGGVFYRSPSPDTAPYVEVGDRVEVGQTIGIIEAMKVFSEVPSEHAGTVLELAAKNGSLVRQGDPLIYLKP